MKVYCPLRRRKVDVEEYCKFCDYYEPDYTGHFGPCRLKR